MEVVAVLCLVALLAGGMTAYSRLSLRRVTKHRVIVHTSDDQSISGMLLRALPAHLVIGHAHLLTEASAEGVPMAGDVIVLRSKVSFMQVTG